METHTQVLNLCVCEDTYWHDAFRAATKHRTGRLKLHSYTSPAPLWLLFSLYPALWPQISIRNHSEVTACLTDHWNQLNTSITSSHSRRVSVCVRIQTQNKEVPALQRSSACIKPRNLSTYLRPELCFSVSSSFLKGFLEESIRILQLQ